MKHSYMGPCEGVTTVLKRVISAWQGFAYLVSPPIVRIMGGGGSKTPGQEVVSSRTMFGTWTAEHEAWWTTTASTYENITTIGDALITFYLLLESSWLVRSEGLRFLNELK